MAHLGDGLPPPPPTHLVWINKEEITQERKSVGQAKQIHPLLTTSNPLPPFRLMSRSALFIQILVFFLENHDKPKIWNLVHGLLRP